MKIVVKATSKGQITLPAKWRKQSDSNQYLLKEDGESLVITPLEVDRLEEEGWETIFDAKRDNNGKGVPLKDLIHTLKKTL